MSGYLLDTNCISELLRTRPDPQVLRWMQAADESMLFLSVLTIGEIRRGLAGLPQGARRTRLEAWLDVELSARFAGRVLPIDSAVANRWGLLAASAKLAGKALSTIDGLLAATAIHHGLTVASRNENDFANLPVPILNPWKA